MNFVASNKFSEKVNNMVDWKIRQLGLQIFHSWQSLEIHDIGLLVLVIMATVSNIDLNKACFKWVMNLYS